jgi:squalene-hopene/tetraprenyl-beta-curcumene cyclase
LEDRCAIANDQQTSVLTQVNELLQSSIKNFWSPEMKRISLTIACVLMLMGATMLSSCAQETAPVVEVQDAAAVQEFDSALHQQTIAKGIDFLLNKGQAEDGSFSKQLSPAVTALCVSAMVKNGIPIAHPKVQKALTHIEALVRPDGGIYLPGSNLRNYETSISLMALNQTNVDGKYDETIKNAVAFLKGIQWGENNGHPIGGESRFYGGQGYGKHERPDMSNTSTFADALREVQEDFSSETGQKIVVFSSRAQNLPSPHNAAEYAMVASDDDRGGMIYTPAGKGESKADPLSTTPKGGLRSYGSMTYAGLKSFLYAGLDREDIRVKSALDWISRHYDLKTNPGMDQQGLYYYYHVFGKTMQAFGEPEIVDDKGVSHNWRAELTAQLALLQREDGSWTNPQDRWYEGDPNLVTAYSLLALSYCNTDPSVKITPKSEQK